MGVELEVEAGVEYVKAAIGPVGTSVVEGNPVIVVAAVSEDMGGIVGRWSLNGNGDVLSESVLNPASTRLFMVTDGVTGTTGVVGVIGEDDVGTDGRSISSISIALNDCATIVLEERMSCVLLILLLLLLSLLEVCEANAEGNEVDDDRTILSSEAGVGNKVTNPCEVWLFLYPIGGRLSLHK